MVVRLGSVSERRALAASVASDAPALFAPDGVFDRVTVLVRNERLRRAWLELVPHVRRAWTLEPSLVPTGLDADGVASLRAAVRGGDGDAAAEVVHAWFADHLIERAARSVAVDDGDPGVPIPEPATLRTHAFDMLYGAILDGTLVPGEDLDEAELTRWLDMSRQPVRHALVRLSEYGLIEMVPNKQPRVAPLDPGRVNRMLLVSLMWNLFTVERTVGRLSMDELAQLDAATADYAERAAGDDLAAKGYALQRVFAIFTGALGNTVLEEQMAAQSYELTGILSPGGSLIDPASLVHPLQALNTAAQAGDVHGAVVVMRALLGVTIENFVDRFRR